MAMPSKRGLNHWEYLKIQRRKTGSEKGNFIDCTGQLLFAVIAHGFMLQMPNTLTKIKAFWQAFYFLKRAITHQKTKKGLASQSNIDGKNYSYHRR